VWVWVFVCVCVCVCVCLCVGAKCVWCKGSCLHTHLFYVCPHCRDLARDHKTRCALIEYEKWVGVCVRLFHAEQCSTVNLGGIFISSSLLNFLSSYPKSIAFHAMPSAPCCLVAWVYSMPVPWLPLPLLAQPTWNQDLLLKRCCSSSDASETQAPKHAFRMGARCREICYL
jgi:hypothetical protein